MSEIVNNQFFSSGKQLSVQYIGHNEYNNFELKFNDQTKNLNSVEAFGNFKFNYTGTISCLIKDEHGQERRAFNIQVIASNGPITFDLRFNFNHNTLEIVINHDSKINTAIEFDILDSSIKYALNINNNFTNLILSNKNKCLDIKLGKIDNMQQVSFHITENNTKEYIQLINTNMLKISGLTSQEQKEGEITYKKLTQEITYAYNEKQFDDILIYLLKINKIKKVCFNGYIFDLKGYFNYFNNETGAKNIDWENIDLILVNFNKVNLLNYKFKSVDIQMRDDTDSKLIIKDCIASENIKIAINKEKINFLGINIDASRFIINNEEYYLKIKNKNQSLQISKGEILNKSINLVFKPFEIQVTDLLNTEYLIDDQLHEQKLTIIFSFLNCSAKELEYEIKKFEELFSSNSNLLKNKFCQLELTIKDIENNNKILIIPDENILDKISKAIEKKDNNFNNIENFFNFNIISIENKKEALINKNLKERIFLIEKYLREKKLISIANKYAYLSELIDYKETLKKDWIVFLWSLYGFGYYESQKLKQGFFILLAGSAFIYLIAVLFSLFLVSNIMTKNCVSNPTEIINYFDLLISHLVPLFKDPTFINTDLIQYYSSCNVKSELHDFKLLKFLAWASNLIMTINITCLIIGIKRKFSRNAV